MSDQSITTIVSAVASVLAALIAAVSVYYMARLKGNSEKAAVEVAVVADTLKANTLATDVKLEGIARVSASTHAFVDGDRGNLLRRLAAATQRNAELSDDLSDARVARDAREEYNAHEQRRVKIDAQYAEGKYPRIIGGGSKQLVQGPL